jgi:ACS family tartrate transporter-like MFS transporter
VINPVDPLGDKLMAAIWRRPAETIAERTRRRVALHLIPYLFFLYILAYLDRVNVSVAQLGMEKQLTEGGLGFERDVIGIGAGIFFWGYWILEVPSTITVVRWGARWVFVRILVLWGLCAALLGTIGTPFAGQLLGWLPYLDDPQYQFYFLRFMLGFFEGGFFPSVIVYLSLWFRQEDRAKAIAGFMIAIPVSSMLGMPISARLLRVEWLGLEGWRWVFILEGIAPIIAGFVTVFLLPDRPHKAAWLPLDERLWLEEELRNELKSKKHDENSQKMQHLHVILLLTVVYFMLNLTSYGLSMFLPAIIKAQSGLSSEAASYVASFPYLVALVGMLVNGWHSDYTRERYWHVAIPLALLSAGIFGAALTDQIGIAPVVFMIFVVGPVLYAHLPAFWPIPTMFLGSTTAAAAIGFINMIGNLGGSIGPMIVGAVARDQASFAPALLRIAPWPLAGAVIIVVICRYRTAAISSSPN